VIHGDDCDGGQSLGRRRLQWKILVGPRHGRTEGQEELALAETVAASCEEASGDCGMRDAEVLRTSLKWHLRRHPHSSPEVTRIHGTGSGCQLNFPNLSPSSALRALNRPRETVLIPNGG